MSHHRQHSAVVGSMEVLAALGDRTVGSITGTGDAGCAQKRGFKIVTVLSLLVCFIVLAEIFGEVVERLVDLCGTFNEWEHEQLESSYLHRQEEAPNISCGTQVDRTQPHPYSITVTYQSTRGFDQESRLPSGDVGVGAGGCKYANKGTSRLPHRHGFTHGGQERGGVCLWIDYHAPQTQQFNCSTAQSRSQEDAGLETQCQVGCPENVKSGHISSITPADALSTLESSRLDQVQYTDQHT
ncbi:hypothetical protein BJY52DRAFT_1229629 [Lactarius psammicola]|nr:hypothetical protein BJY52DRAFT_1229629 [Lactarius psammicola]